MILFGVIMILYPLFNHKNKKIYLFIISILIFSIMAFRDSSVGTDIENYLEMYSMNDREPLSIMLKNLLLPKYWIADPLYTIYCSILNLLGISKRGFLIITSAIFIYSMGVFIKRYSNNYLISIFTFLTIGLFSLYMSALRQSLAISVVLFAYKYLLEKKPIKFYLLAIIAIGFHITAIVIMPAYIIMKILEGKKPEFIISISIALGVIFLSIINNILNMLNLGTRFSVYLNGNIIRTNPLLVILYITIALICIFLKYIAGKRDGNDFTKLVDIHFIMYAVSIGIIILSMQNTMLSRFANYYAIVLPIILGNSINLIRNKKDRIIADLMCIVVEIAFFLCTIPDSVYNIANYKFY